MVVLLCYACIAVLCSCMLKFDWWIMIFFMEMMMKQWWRNDENATTTTGRATTMNRAFISFRYFSLLSWHVVVVLCLYCCAWQLDTEVWLMNQWNNNASTIWSDDNMSRDETTTIGCGRTTNRFFGEVTHDLVRRSDGAGVGHHPKTIFRTF